MGVGKSVTRNSKLEAGNLRSGEGQAESSVRGKEEEYREKSETRNSKSETNTETSEVGKLQREEPQTASEKSQGEEGEVENTKTNSLADPQQNPSDAPPERTSNYEPQTSARSGAEGTNSEPQTANPTSRLKRKKRSGFSIAETLNGSVKEETEKKEEDLSPDPSLPKDDFDENRLVNIWNEYLEIVKSEGRQKIYSSLSNKDLKLKENFTAELQLENDIQESFFKEEKTELLKFMRNQLNNFSLQFEIKKIKGTKTLEPYSPQEKFEYMLKKNPHLLLLKQKLDLDIE